ncbi:hypothetical protein [Wenyingzhuangia marina]|uniref:Uncharacterized protein n=1 Tax=Wenyingzhuangia marina TaxID=1195760 RepID=A0A1M5V4C1_9FLAO|nr:hypothetical protein [Wenyingzhuangia marina]GGF74514.1 hypothetical protein GCM10011397_16830 [Wenyingzhuangia marina]SHH70026.1 hypothetical protein SAMN05444281_1494 [Wenyingzhuangia marina]
MKDYKNLAEIKRDLKVLQLKRKIAIEELKYVKKSTVENFQPYHWLQAYLIKKATKLGIEFLFRTKNKA